MDLDALPTIRYVGGGIYLIGDDTHGVGAVAALDILMAAGATYKQAQKIIKTAREARK